MAKFSLESEFFCVKCGNKGIPIMRKKGAEREAGHLKRLYCLTCKKEWNHAECRPNTKYTYNEFLIEFQNNNFDEEGNRVFPYGEFKKIMNKKEIKSE